MANIVNIEPRRIRKEHKRKDARAKELKESLRKARQEQLTLPENKQHATNKLLALFRTKKPQKPSTPTGGK